MEGKGVSVFFSARMPWIEVVGFALLILASQTG
jgi:hypothetical protein